MDHIPSIEQDEIMAVAQALTESGASFETRCAFALLTEDRSLLTRSESMALVSCDALKDDLASYWDLMPWSARQMIISPVRVDWLAVCDALLANYDHREARIDAELGEALG